MRVFPFAWLLAAGALAQAQSFQDFEKRVTAFTLSNGLRFVVLERHEAPLISFHTYIAAGSVNDPAGQTGLTHLLERMAFTGSESIGTRNWPEEKKALDAVDETYERAEAERNKGARMNQTQYDTLRTHWRLAMDSAARLGQPGEYRKILEDNGATNLRSTGSYTALEFAYTLPSNRMELWFDMESQRLMHPALRNFYVERENVIEELQKNLSNPRTRILDAFQSLAFATHPYRVPVAGWPSDAAELKLSAARAFVERNFVPGNITIAMAGDVVPEEAKRFAEKYFGAMPAKPMPDQLHTMEPPQQGPRTAALDLPIQPVGAIGYKRPSYLDKDDTVLDVVQQILVSGKSGMAYRELVEERRLAVALQAGATYPDGHYTNTFLFFVTPTPGHTVEENQKALDEVLARLKTQKVGGDVLNRAKSQVRAQSYQRLADNDTMAEMLAIYSSAYGDWKKLPSLVEDVRKVTEEDVMRVAQRYFNSASRTTVFSTIPGLPAAPAQGKSGAGQ